MKERPLLQLLGLTWEQFKLIYDKLSDTEKELLHIRDGEDFEHSQRKRPYTAEEARKANYLIRIKLPREARKMYGKPKKVCKVSEEDAKAPITSALTEENAKSFYQMIRLLTKVNGLFNYKKI